MIRTPGPTRRCNALKGYILLGLWGNSQPDLVRKLASSGDKHHQLVACSLLAMMDKKLVIYSRRSMLKPALLLQVVSC